MVNLMVAPKLPWTKWVRPYGVAGVGLIRARGCSRPNCVTDFNRTDLGIDVGAGVLVPFNDILGVRKSDYMTGTSDNLQNTQANIFEQARKRTATIEAATKID